MPPIVSCICVTKNRVDLLKRTIQCFNSQTFDSKELIIVSIDDKATNSFAESNLEYNQIHLKEHAQKSPDIFIKPTSKDSQLVELISGDTISIFDSNNKYFNPETNQFDLDTEVELFVISELNNNKCYLSSLSKDSFIELTPKGDLIISKNKKTISLHQSYRDKIRFEIPHQNDSVDIPELSKEGWYIASERNTDSNITFVNFSPNAPISLGLQRNLGIKFTNGKYICVWDDDDWYSPHRIKTQYEALQLAKKDACTLSHQVLFDANSDNAYLTFPRSEGCENSLLCEKEMMGTYADLPKKEDTPVLRRLWEKRNLTVIEAPFMYIYNIHKFNTCPSDHFLFMIKTSILLKNSDEVKRILNHYKLSNN